MNSEARLSEEKARSAMIDAARYRMVQKHNVPKVANSYAKFDEDISNYFLIPRAKNESFTDTQIKLTLNLQLIRAVWTFSKISSNFLLVEYFQHFSFFTHAK